MKEQILNYLESPLRDSVLWFDTIDSTNTQAKLLAARGAPHGTVLIADHQTVGRGRLGRTFLSPAGSGIYLSMILRPHCSPGALMHLTCAAAVAAVSAIEALTDKRPAIKWVNDMYLNGCKAGGILTEAVTRPDGLHRMAVGIGLNLSTTEFPEGLRAPAASLFTGEEAAALPSDFPDTLAGEIARRLLELAEASPACPFPEGMKGEACLDFYRRRLLYVGEPVVCTRGAERIEGILQGVDRDYSLLVDTDGEVLTLSSGEISVRPLEKN